MLNKKRLIILSVFWCTLLPIIFSGPVQGEGSLRIDDELVFRKAADFLNQGMYLEAIGVYREIADYSEYREMRARALLFMGTTMSLYLNNPNEAISVFNHVVNTYPDSQAAPDALFNSGMTYYEKGEYAAAHQAFVRYLDTYPKGIRRQSVEVWAQSAEELIHTPIAGNHSQTGPILIDTIIRVLLAKCESSFTLSGKGRIKITGVPSGRTAYQGENPATVSATNGKLIVNGRPLSDNRVTVVSEGATINLSPSATYRGELTISADAQGLSVINHIPVEEYLYGVVPREMPHTWEMEALKAQAISARTYVLYIKEKSGDKPFDVEATTSSQMYGGYPAERERTTQAVNATRGRVIAYQGDLIVAYFHADSGGHTEDAGNVWGMNLPYLKGVPDDFSTHTPNSSWEVYLPFAEMRNRLTRSGIDVGSITDIKPEAQSASGRTLALALGSTKGTAKMTGNNFRIRVGAEKLKSTLFHAEPFKNGVRFRGKGYGHGVGLSQWGAQTMALKGYSANDILNHYYRDVNIVSLKID